MSEPIYKPFIKRVWWKRQLLEQFQNLFPRSFSDQKIDHYYEPFLWWGAVFFNLRNKFWTKFKADLYDVNPELINTYNIVKNNPSELISELKKYPYNKEKFLEIRARDQLPNFQTEKTEIERAARFIYLNRTCFNWMYRVNKNWFFNVPFWKYSNPKICDEETIFYCSKALQNTNICNYDFSKIIESTKKWDFVYLDPPYDILSNTSNFTDYNTWWFWREEQERLSQIFKQLDKKWCYVMLSNHATERIQNLYKSYRQVIVKATRMINSNAKNRWAIDEIVILNYEN